MSNLTEDEKRTLWAKGFGTALMFAGSHIRPLQMLAIMHHPQAVDIVVTMANAAANAMGEAGEIDEPQTGAGVDALVDALVPMLPDVDVIGVLHAVLGDEGPEEEAVN